MVIDSNFCNGASLIPESSKANAIEAAAVQAVESGSVGVELKAEQAVLERTALFG